LVLYSFVFPLKKKTKKQHAAFNPKFTDMMSTVTNLNETNALITKFGVNKC
jgi:hypothetical protein